MIAVRITKQVLLHCGREMPRLLNDVRPPRQQQLALAHAHSTASECAQNDGG